MNKAQREAPDIWHWGKKLGDIPACLLVVTLVPVIPHLNGPDQGADQGFRGVSMEPSLK